MFAVAVFQGLKPGRTRGLEEEEELGREGREEVEEVKLLELSPSLGIVLATVPDSRTPGGRRGRGARRRIGGHF